MVLASSLVFVSGGSGSLLVRGAGSLLFCGGGSFLMRCGAGLLLHADVPSILFVRCGGGCVFLVCCW